MVKKKGKKTNLKKTVVAKQSTISESKNSEVIAASLVPVHQPVFIKVCRLCETKDGPFLNIFEADKLTAKKIHAVMPFRVTENDDLPHKICFRCSAKLEELYEFIQKCIRTQNRLQNVLGKKQPKAKHRQLWEEKLNQSNISNDDICDALIKKAMEGIKDIPLNPKPLGGSETPLLKQNNDDDPPRNTTERAKKTFNDKKDLVTVKKETNIKQEESVTEVSQEFSADTPVARSLRSCNEMKSNEMEKIDKPKETSKTEKKVKNTAIVMEVEVKKMKEKEIPQTNTFSLNDATPKTDPTFNIMEHVSMIKVNGVGVLFQCKLCNRNFLKKQVVMSHACAKNGATKILGPKPIIAPEPPKVSTVKYINTKTNAVKTTEEETKIDNEPIELNDVDTPIAVKRPKPKIGPASKVRRQNDDDPANKVSETVVAPPNASATVVSLPNSSAPVVQMPKSPSLNSRYKLMAGPNNTFVLVEEKVKTMPEENPDRAKSKLTIISPNIAEKPPVQVPTENRPYPVKLFKTLAHNSNLEPAAFTTPAMKKQSYTVVQTGNPSKLLISSKPQPVEEVPKKRLRRNKQENKEDDSKKEPFSVTLEELTPAKDTGFFTFVNVDPLLQPSYVLPTDNIIQESQISTSTNVAKQNIVKDTDNYSCNMCNEVFSREKKLLAHIHSHYSKMDEEDQVRAEKPGRKRRK